MYDSPFTPRGPTYSVSATSPVQILSFPDSAYSSVRVINLASTVTRIGWINQINNPGNVNISAPTVTSSSPNMITLEGSKSQTLSLPMNCWMQASQATEVTPGEGGV